MHQGLTPSVRELRDNYLISILFPIAFSTLFEKYLKEEDVPAEAVEADAPEAVANGAAADKNGGGSKGKYDRPGNVKRPKAKKNEVNFSSNFVKGVCSKPYGKAIIAPFFCFLR